MENAMSGRRICRLIAKSLCVWVIPLLLAGTTRAQTPFTFRDVGNETGLFPGVANIAGHGVGWGDVNGDGWPDLYVATFGGHPYARSAAAFTGAGACQRCGLHRL